MYSNFYIPVMREAFMKTDCVSFLIYIQIYAFFYSYLSFLYLHMQMYAFLSCVKRARHLIYESKSENLRIRTLQVFSIGEEEVAHEGGFESNGRTKTRACHGRDAIVADELTGILGRRI